MKYRYVRCIDDKDVKLPSNSFILVLNEIYKVNFENDLYYWFEKKDKTGLAGFKKERFIDVSRLIKIKRIINKNDSK
jgi:hypothetical protein